MNTMVSFITSQKGTFDGTVVDVGISLERSNLVDFSTPLVVGDHRIVIRTPGTAASLTTFTSTFDPDFWLVFCLNLLLCTTGLYLLTQVGDRDDHSDLTLGDCFALNCKICVWIGVGWVPTRVSARILFLSILFFGTVFWASYQVRKPKRMGTIEDTKLNKDRKIDHALVL